MYFFNVTQPGTNMTAYLNSEHGKRFPVNNTLSSVSTLGLDFTPVQTLPKFASLLSSSLPECSFNQDLEGQYVPVTDYYQNPFNITPMGFLYINDDCRGWGRFDKVNTTNVML